MIHLDGAIHASLVQTHFFPRTCIDAFGSIGGDFNASGSTARGGDTTYGSIG